MLQHTKTTPNIWCVSFRPSAASYRLYGRLIDEPAAVFVVCVALSRTAFGSAKRETKPAADRPLSKPSRQLLAK